MLYLLYIITFIAVLSIASIFDFNTKTTDYVYNVNESPKSITIVPVSIKNDNNNNHNAEKKDTVFQQFENNLINTRDDINPNQVISSNNLVTLSNNQEIPSEKNVYKTDINLNWIGLITSLVNLSITVGMFFLYNFSSVHFQFVQEYQNVDIIIKNLPFDFYLGVDGTSIYFIMLTGIIMPIAILSNWKSIKENKKSYIIIMLLLEILLITVFLVLDTLSFYIFFESILPPLFLLVGLFGSSNKVKASFYLFLYTLLGSLFMLLSILTISSLMGVSDYNALYKDCFDYSTQIYLFIGIFIAFAVKTPTIFLNTWLLKAHVESPLGGSIILAAIVLKLSLYGIMRLILPVLPTVTFNYITIVYTIAVITILYASISTLRTVDIKELIAYSSVSHAAVYILGIFSNTIIGIEGAIVLGLAHGFVSSGLFICVGGVLYDRSSTRLITCYRGMTQIMPLFSILFFILCLGNSGTPLTLNFVGEFMCLYGSFEQLPVLGAIACSSIVFSAAYTIYMYNRIAFGGYFSKFFINNIIDLNLREFYILSLLVIFAVILGIYTAPILDGLHFTVSSLIYTISDDFSLITYSSLLFITSKRTNKINLLIIKRYKSTENNNNTEHTKPENFNLTDKIKGLITKFTSKTTLKIIMRMAFTSLILYTIRFAISRYDINVFSDITHIVSILYFIFVPIFTGLTVCSELDIFVLDCFIYIKRWIVYWFNYPINIKPWIKPWLKQLIERLLKPLINFHNNLINDLNSRLECNKLKLGGELPNHKYSQVMLSNSNGKLPTLEPKVNLEPNTVNSNRNTNLTGQVPENNPIGQHVSYDTSNHLTLGLAILQRAQLIIDYKIRTQNIPTGYVTVTLADLGIQRCSTEHYMILEAIRNYPYNSRGNTFNAISNNTGRNYGIITIASGTSGVYGLNSYRLSPFGGGFKLLNHIRDYYPPSN